MEWFVELTRVDPQMAGSLLFAVVLVAMSIGWGLHGFRLVEHSTRVEINPGPENIPDAERQVEIGDQP